ncbi:Hypothetical predicted protein [Olea europaea subsp. europaea]|uniref:Uncharacterized protein n=1 Tax=Olea europaea subsp. europaea TaxID=158383 RepID=A0A8S0QLR3_OLEEU|nr:Hypothetical predicted protein [Olea europaea subsp. europaea]
MGGERDFCLFPIIAGPFSTDSLEKPSSKENAKHTTKMKSIVYLKLSSKRGVFPLLLLKNWSLTPTKQALQKAVR